LTELRIEPTPRLSHEPLSLKFWPPRYEGNLRRLSGQRQAVTQRCARGIDQMLGQQPPDGMANAAGPEPFVGANTASRARESSAMTAPSHRTPDNAAQRRRTTLRRDDAIVTAGYVPTTIWRLDRDDSTAAITPDNRFASRLTSRLIRVYTDHGDTIVDLTHDPHVEHAGIHVSRPCLASADARWACPVLTDIRDQGTWGLREDVRHHGEHGEEAIEAAAGVHA
ncbi:hypothetical protein ABT369_52590, partial [Dactylosporangium sp. NPDC000244]|uniref:hypothetical protein n=1 Tax=Dactylosporangium sp. NPDC000244 TaxID=3154365 RepID=UPI003327D0AE